MQPISTTGSLPRGKITNIADESANLCADVCSALIAVFGTEFCFEFPAGGCLSRVNQLVPQTILQTTRFTTPHIISRVGASTQFVPFTLEQH